MKLVVVVIGMGCTDMLLEIGIMLSICNTELPDVAHLLWRLKCRFDSSLQASHADVEKVREETEIENSTTE